jgi:hypothetical protein
LAGPLLPAFAVAAALLVIAGAAKIVAPAQAVDSLRAAGASIPAFGVRALGTVEAAVGTAAALAPSTATAIALAIAYAGFCLFLLRLIRNGNSNLDCGCFGGSGAQATPAHVALNATALAVCVAAAIHPPASLTSLIEGGTFTGLTAVVGIAACVYAAYLAFTAWPKAWGAYQSEAPR